MAKLSATDISTWHGIYTYT